MGARHRITAILSHWISDLQASALNMLTVLVGEPRDQNKANFNKVRQIAKFGMIVYYKIVINNLI